MSDPLIPFTYSERFREAIAHLQRGKEHLPSYDYYIASSLGGRDSRLARFVRDLCPEIEHHCGTLAGNRILDFGCGTGATTVALWHHFGSHLAALHAFDIDEESVAICRQRLSEHGAAEAITPHCAPDFGTIANSLGTFDLVLLNGVLEHIPLSVAGLRQKVLRSVFQALAPGGFLFLNETPNRLWPVDSHTTGLWWGPWTKAGSQWAYRRAVAAGKHAETPAVSPGPLGLEERGAWGASYRELVGYLDAGSFTCLNMQPGHDRHLYYSHRGSPKRVLAEVVGYYLVTKLLRRPLTAFTPSLTNLVLQKRR